MIEQTILACCIKFPNKINSIMSEIGASDFYDEIYKSTFEDIRRYAASHTVVDHTSLLIHLSKVGAISTSDLSGLVDMSPSHLNLDEYMGLLKEESAKNVLHRLSVEVGLMSKGGDRSIDIIEKIHGVLHSVQTRAGFQNEITLLPELFQYFQDEKKREFSDSGHNMIETGFRNLDKFIGGFKRGALIVLGAETGGGKSAFALNIARHAAFIQKKRVDFFSLEMNRNEVFERLLVLQSGVPTGNYKDASSLMRLNGAYNFIFEENKGRFIVQDSTDLSVTNIKSRVLGLNNSEVDPELGLIVIDYLQLLSSGEKTTNRTEEVGKITRELKRLAGELNVPILALSQLNRQAKEYAPKENEQGQEKEPDRIQLSRLRESGTIAQDANQVLFIARGAKGDVAYLDIAKNRNGPSDIRINFSFVGKRYDFGEQPVQPHLQRHLQQEAEQYALEKYND